MALYQFVNNEWQLLYNSYTPTIYDMYEDPTTIVDQEGNPVYNVQVGDYWAKIDQYGQNKLLSFYERASETQEGEMVETWHLKFNGGGGGSTLIINVGHAILINKNGENNE